jgi:hypothetical protein
VQSMKVGQKLGHNTSCVAKVQERQVAQEEVFVVEGPIVRK